MARGIGRHPQIHNSKIEPPHLARPSRGKVRSLLDTLYLRDTLLYIIKQPCAQRLLTGREHKLSAVLAMLMP